MIHYSQQFYQGSGLASLPIVSTFLFLAVFVGVLAYVAFAPRGFSALSRLPLDDDRPARHAPASDEASDG